MTLSRSLLVAILLIPFAMAENVDRDPVISRFYEQATTMGVPHKLLDEWLAHKIDIQYEYETSLNSLIDWIFLSQNDFRKDLVGDKPGPLVRVPAGLTTREAILTRVAREGKLELLLNYRGTIEFVPIGAGKR